MANLLTMLVQETKAQIYARGLTIAQGLGLTTTSWQPGDPTRSLYHFLSDSIATLEELVSGFLKSGFLEHATGDWLTILAKQVFNVDRVEATYASAPVTLTNAGGGLYVIEIGDVVLQNSSTGKTYTNATGGTLSALGTLALDFTADEVGSDSNAGAGDIDTLVTTLLGVTCSNTLGALGLDEESDEALRERCRAKLGMLSPNGPSDSYNAVVRDPTLTFTTAITRSRTISDSTTGDVVVYVAGPSGAVGSTPVGLAQTAVEKWSTPCCMTPTVTDSSNVTVAVTYEVWLYDSVGEETATIEAKIAADLAALFARRPIGGDIIAPATTGAIYKSLIQDTIRSAYPSDTFRVVVTAPSGDTTLAINEVAALGTVTPTAPPHLEARP